jgi:hypothetical protein
VIWSVESFALGAFAGGFLVLAVVLALVLIEKQS